MLFVYHLEVTDWPTGHIVLETRLSSGCTLPATNDEMYSSETRHTNSLFIKIKLTLYLIKYHPMKTYGGSRVIAPRTFNLGTRWTLVISFTSWPPFHSQEHTSPPSLWTAPGSNSGHLNEVPRSFGSLSQANVWSVHSNRPRPSPSKPLPSHHSW
jgi:hypothetical protein